jgi:hypothetical protein
MTKYTKETALAAWRGMTRKINPLPLMRAIPYKTSGSKYGTCGIRIDGTPEFIDAVLSHLTDLLPGEGVETRLELARRPVEGVEINGTRKTFENRAVAAEVCYIRLHERGEEGKMLAAYSQVSA